MNRIVEEVAKPKQVPKQVPKQRRKKRDEGGYLKPEYAVSNNRGPYWDPHDIHVHIWVRGTIHSVENHKKRYSNGDPKPYTGIYCKVCHEIKIPFAQDLQDNMPIEPYYEKNIKLAMKLIDNSVIIPSIPKTPFIHPKPEERLILNNTKCKIPNTVNECRIISQMPNKSVLVDDGTTKYTVEPNRVSSIYRLINTKLDPIVLLFPIYVRNYQEAPYASMPIMVPREDIEKLKKNWEIYCNWKIMQYELSKRIDKIKKTIGIEIIMMETFHTMQSFKGLSINDIQPVLQNNTKKCSCPKFAAYCSCWRYEEFNNNPRPSWLIPREKITSNYVLIAENS